MSVKLLEEVMEWDPARVSGRIACSEGLPSQADRLTALCGQVAEAAQRLGPVQALLARRVRTVLDGATLEEREELFVRVETAHGALLESWGAPTSRGVPPAEVAAGLQRRLSRARGALSANAGPLPTDLPLALSPSVAAPLVSALALLLRGDIAAASGLSRNLGKRAFPPVMTLADVPAHPQGSRERKVDDEGTPCAAVTLVDAGTLSGLLHSKETAGTQRANGRGFAADGGAPSPSPLNLHLREGTAPLPPDRVELDCRIETFTPSPRLGHVSLRVAGRELRGDRTYAQIAPFDLELPVLATFRRLIATGGELTFFPAFDGVGTPWLVLAPGGK